MVILDIVQIVVAGLLSAAILLQQRGTGVGGAFGGGSSESHYTKRGADRFLFTGSIVLAIAFFALAILRHFV